MLNIGAHDTVFRGNSAELTDQAWRSFVIHQRIFSSRLLPIFCSLLTIGKIFYREKSRFYLAVINTSPPHTPPPHPIPRTVLIDVCIIFLDPKFLPMALWSVEPYNKGQLSKKLEKFVLLIKFGKKRSIVKLGSFSFILHEG